MMPYELGFEEDDTEEDACIKLGEKIVRTLERNAGGFFVAASSEVSEETTASSSYTSSANPGC